jgi:hypothetical protein
LLRLFGRDEKDAQRHDNNRSKSDRSPSPTKNKRRGSSLGAAARRQDLHERAILHDGRQRWFEVRDLAAQIQKVGPRLQAVHARQQVTFNLARLSRREFPID